MCRIRYRIAQTRHKCAALGTEEQNKAKVCKISYRIAQTRHKGAQLGTD